MFLPDVNVLIYAHRKDAEEHAAYASWLRRLVEGREPFAMSELVLVGFLRITTNARAFRVPTPSDVALAFVDEICRKPGCRLVRPGERHFEIFRDLYKVTGAVGARIADLQHAAVAIEHGCEWVTCDADFARIPDLRWRHPLQAPTRR
ncbi:MAG TPA: type II toxin-antitoxin system VapC family toxin [Polyangia bacterium]